MDFGKLWAEKFSKLISFDTYNYTAWKTHLFVIKL